MKFSTSPSFGIYFALCISLVLAILKTIIWFLSWSLAILGSALDSFMDMFVSGVNALALWLSEKTRTNNYSYGLGKVQGFAAIFEWWVVFSSWVFLWYNGINNLLEKKMPIITNTEILVMIMAIIGTAIIMWNFLRISKVHNSLIIRSDALHYSSDLVMNGGIIIALLLTKYYSLWWTDAIFALFIAVWIIKNALPIIWNGISMLLDKSLSTQEIEITKDAFNDEKSLEWFHYLKTRQSGDNIFIEAHIVFHDKKISLRKAHDISESLESVIWAKFPWAMLTLHLDLDSEPEICIIPTK